MRDPMPPDDPRHGTYAGAVAHQKSGELLQVCTPCLLAARRARKRWRLAKMHGREHTVPLGKEAWRLLTCTTAEQMARRSGIGLSSIHRLRSAGPDTVVLASTRDKILAANLPTAIGIQRRLRALARLGWSMRMVAAEMGTRWPDNLLVLLRRDQVKYVREDFALAVVAVYERLSMRLPPDGPGVSRARNRALAEGWYPPLAWDDIDHDARPHRRDRTPRKGDVDEMAVERAMSGDTVTLTRAERLEVVRRWQASGRPLNECQRVTGINAIRCLREMREVS